MKFFADSCTCNLRVWSKRRKGLEITQNERANVSSTTPRHPDDFMTAFPLTLPTTHRAPQPEEPSLVWPSAASSRSSESSSSDSNLCSPSGSVSSFAFSPVSESSASNHSNFNGRLPSNGDSVSVLGTLTAAQPAHTDGRAAIRAAGKLGIRKQKSINRNSWSPSAYSLSSGQTAVPVPKSAFALLVSTTTNAAVPPAILSPDLGVADTIVINPIKFDKASKVART